MEAKKGGCQNDGPVLGTLNNRCRIIIGTQKGTIILTTHMVSALTDFMVSGLKVRSKQGSELYRFGRFKLQERFEAFREKGLG